MLFILPSRYLCAIGLLPIFSVGRGISPIWCCISKQHDSTVFAPLMPRGGGTRGSSPSMAPLSRGLILHPSGRAQNQHHIADARNGRLLIGLRCFLVARRYQGNRCCFLFLRRMICLSSAGDPASLRSCRKILRSGSIAERPPTGNWKFHCAVMRSLLRPTTGEAQALGSGARLRAAVGPRSPRTPGRRGATGIRRSRKRSLPR